MLHQAVLAVGTGIEAGKAIPEVEAGSKELRQSEVDSAPDVRHWMAVRGRVLDSISQRVSAQPCRHIRCNGGQHWNVIVEAETIHVLDHFDFIGPEVVGSAQSCSRRGKKPFHFPTRVEM